MDNCPSILKKNLRGMSLTEILIVVSILSIIAVGLIAAFQPSTQLAKARDARRKADLQKLKSPLEDYYNDNKCYPDASLLVCSPGTAFQPYKDKVPCDPETGKSYVYEKVDCNTYRIYVKLENKSDTDIAAVGCSGGCGPSPFDYNWGISSPNTQLIVGECTGIWWQCQSDVCNNTGSSKKPTCSTGVNAVFCDKCVDGVDCGPHEPNCNP
jgi:prepilin-type N-terminal cleavage/methylation domain-containing protein